MYKKRIALIFRSHKYINLGVVPFCFGGLWERWEKGSDGPLETCAMLTIGSNAVMEPNHHGMPVILQPRDYDTWLDPSLQDPTLLSSLLQPYPP